ncbi:thyrotropin-releasing hormone receptor-like [Acanthaster planci]|uniref:Thyrotropin-releasing hormone receptor-like n=1 Tax=Acanthaster planci TaxID=133434 RepID=A0A8B7ZAE2_ACAPL|nr:thyrotropin-releasing hormone receptor-like [Acanthaster planci]XP_022102645.1 thyrotropin-releasing hormone receptor-like [Acanthaster planci]XP_022102646.1 thyrotropin-releasing hormone receptor-like [Acanthaster planci]
MAVHVPVDDDVGLLPLRDQVEPPLAFRAFNECPSPDLSVVDLSDPSKADLYSYKSAHVVMITIIYPCLCTVGLVANLAFLVSVWRVKYMRTITNIYLSNLAVADIIFLVTGTSFGLWKYFVTPVTSDFSLCGGPVGCFALVHLNATPFQASTLLVTLVSLERYLAICRSIYHHRINSQKRTVGLVVCVWLAAILLSSVLSSSGTEYTTTCVSWPAEDKYRSYPQTIASCFTLGAVWLHAASFAVYVVPYFIEFTIAVVVFYKILNTLQKRSNISGTVSAQPGANDNVNRIRNRVAFMLVIAGITSFSLVTPRVIVTIYSYVIFFAGITGPLTQDQIFVIYITVNLLLYLNSVLNPFIYAFCNSRYRASVVEAFFGRCVSSGNNMSYERDTNMANNDANRRTETTM